MNTPETQPPGSTAAPCSAADDPFKLAKEIRRGERDDEMPYFDVLTGWLERVPLTWLPSLLIRIVTHCVTRNVFRDTAALVRTVQRAADQAHNQAGMLRNSEPPNSD